MSEDQEDVKPGKFSKHKLMLLVAGAATTALVLTVISMALYDWSGAALLDLSRPGYRSVQKKANVSERFDGFSASGKIDKKVLDGFRKMYNEQSSKSDKIDIFSGDVLEDSTLEINDPETLPQPVQ